MKKKFIAMALVIILALSTGCAGRNAASRLSAAIEDAGFMYEADFNAEYYGGRFGTAEEMHAQMARDGVSGLIIPADDGLEQPGLVEYSAFELCGFYLDGESLFFPSAARISLAEFESRAAAAEFFHQRRENILTAGGEATEDSEHCVCVTTGDGMAILSQKGKIVLSFTGESGNALAAIEKCGF